MTLSKNVSIRQLKALAATVRLNSVTEAARALGVTPPAISTQLKLLETIVGGAVLDRSSDRFILTEIGREVLDAAKAIEQTLIKTDQRVAALRSGAAGLVVFGAVSTAKYFAPAIVAAFQKSNPNIRIKLIVGNREDIIEGLGRNEFDLLIMGRPPDHIPIEKFALGEHPHVLISSPNHMLAGRHEITTIDLETERFLAREPGSGTRLLMERFLERLGTGHRYDIVQMGTNETIKQAVMAGLGIALISAHTCLSELHDGRLIALNTPGLPVIRQWYLVHRSDHPLSAASNTFKTYVLEHRAELIPR
ncbi:MAG: LysR family transcriptional regulator [Hyphomicrobiaceae bacterium]